MSLNSSETLKTFLKVDSPKYGDKPYYSINKSRKTITLFDVSESFNTKKEVNNELLFENYDEELESNIKVSMTSKRHKNYIEFFVSYFNDKENKTYLEDERYYYYDKKKIDECLKNNNLRIIKIDNGYGIKGFDHKHIYHVGR